MPFFWSFNAVGLSLHFEVAGRRSRSQLRSHWKFTIIIQDGYGGHVRTQNYSWITSGVSFSIPDIKAHGGNMVSTWYGTPPPNRHPLGPISLVIRGPGGPNTLVIWGLGGPRTLVTWGPFGDLGPLCTQMKSYSISTRQQRTSQTSSIRFWK